MTEIPPVARSCPVLKTGKDKKDNRLKKAPRKKKQAAEDQDTEPAQHIDVSI